MLRKLFNVCTLASFLLALICAWCWVQSESTVGQFSFERNGSETVRLWSFDGKFIISRSVVDAPSEEAAGHVTWLSTPRPENGGAPEGLTLASAFSFRQNPLKGSKGTESVLILPAWALTAAFALLPAWWIAKKIKPIRKKAAA